MRAWYRRQLLALVLAMLRARLPAWRAKARRGGHERLRRLIDALDTLLEFAETGELQAVIAGDPPSG